MATLIAGGDATRADRLVYRTEPLAAARRLTAAPRVTLQVAAENRTAANVTVALVSYDSTGRATLLTRGWADPQNAAGLRDRGTPLTPGTPVTLSFAMEPQERLIPAGSHIGLLVASTDYDHTLRPTAGTRLRIEPRAAR